jgi:hypothetical protein
LAPLEFCTELKTLHLFDNKLENIRIASLKKNKKLRNLTLTNNAFDIVDISYLFLLPQLVKFGLEPEVKVKATKKAKGRTNIPAPLKPFLDNLEWV